jgi:hypothetical protein
MDNECIICNKILDINEVYLCEKHTQGLTQLLQISTSNIIIHKPDFKYHCMICGEWKNRILVNYPSWCYICDKCIDYSKNIYKTK